MQVKFKVKEKGEQPKLFTQLPYRYKYFTKHPLEKHPISCEISFSNGNNVYLNNKVSNPGYREDGKHIILLAFYDDTKLIDVKTIEKEETRAEAEYVDTYSEDWPFGADSVRVFVWDNVNNIVPFGRVTTKQR